jgi:hypothetical protein
MERVKDLLLELTRELIDLKLEKKNYNRDMNEKLKDVNSRIAQVVKEEK